MAETNGKLYTLREIRKREQAAFMAGARWRYSRISREAAVPPVCDPEYKAAAEAEYPTPKEHRIIHIGGGEYRCRNGVVEIKAADNQWVPSVSYNTEVVLKLASLHNNPYIED